MPYLLGIDIGTTGAKAILIDDLGHIISSGQAEYPLSAPHPLWSEQSPEDWWQGAVLAIRDALRNTSIQPEAIAAIGVTGQMHGAVFLDTHGEVIRPAILWNDQRTAAECQEITEREGQEALIAIAGNPALTGFQAPKILWLRHNEPENYARVAHVLLPKDYLRYRLSGEFASDASDAAGTLLLDLHSRDWSAEILEKLDLPRSWFPAVFEGPEVTGRLSGEAARLVGLPAGLPVIAGGGDNAAAAVGTGVVRSGVISSSIGTSGVLFAHSDQIALDPQGRLHTFCHTVPQKYHLMAVTLSAGGSFRWLRDVLRTASSGERVLGYPELTALAESVPPGAEGLVFLPYLTGERTPHLDPLASGGFIGLTSRHTLGHLVRAVMEGVVFSLRDGLEIMRELGVPIHEIRATGGGARSPFWRQMQADIYNTEILSLAAEEGPAYGAALLGGVGAGIFSSVEDAADRCVVVGEASQPDAAAAERYDALYAVYHSLYPHLREDMHNLYQAGHAAEQAAG